MVFFPFCVLAERLLARSSDTELFTASPSAAIHNPVFYSSSPHLPEGHILISFHPEVLPRVKTMLLTVLPLAAVVAAPSISL